MDKLILRPEHWGQMLADVTKRDMEEACGLVGGQDNTSMGVFPATNILHSRTRYRLDPEEQLRIFNQLDENEWELLAIYHSHLNGPPGPSPIDVAEAMYPGVVYLIWFRLEGNWDCRGYLIEKGVVEQVPIFVSG
jgi:proteasome lid subunit RPN8/RPN11